MSSPKRPFKFSDWIAAGQFLDEHDAACGMGAFIDRESWTGHDSPSDEERERSQALMDALNPFSRSNSANINRGAEFVGVNTEGEICSKNGQPFRLPDGRIFDIRRYLAAGDIVTYPNGRNQWRITFVDADTVKMIGL